MFVLVLIILLINPQGATEGAREGLKVAFETVIPSILPFATFASALVYSGGAEKVGRVVAPVLKRVGLNPLGAVAFLSGAMGGYPTGCRIVCDMQSMGLVDKSEAEKMLAYVNNGGVVFALNICGRNAFGSERAGAVIFIAAILSSLVSARLLGKSNNFNAAFAKNKKTPLMAALGKAVGAGGGMIINIASAFVVFYAVTYALNLYKNPVLAGVMEMTQGVMYAGKINNLPLGAFFFSLGGVSVYAQSAALCAEGGISLKRYIAGKLISAILSFVIAALLWEINLPSADVVLFSLLAVLGIICAVKIISSYGLLEPIKKHR